MKTIRLLLTCVGGYFSLCTLKALRQISWTDIVIVGTDAEPDIVAKHYVDTFHVVPMGNHPKYIEALLGICKREKIDVVIPCSDEEAVAISKHRQVFTDSGIVCAVEDYEKIEFLNDKSKLYQTLLDNRIPVPKFKIISNIEEIKALADYFDYPHNKFVMKPISGRGSRGVWIVGEDDTSIKLDELFAHYISLEKEALALLAVEYLPGEAYDVDVIARNGKVICIIPRRRVYKNRLSNFSEGHLVEKNIEIINYAERVVSILNLNGPFDFDCGNFSNETPSVYEINPRLSGSVATGLGAGVNLLEILIKVLLEFPLPEIKIKYGVRMYPYHDMAFEKDGKVFNLDSIER